MKPNECVVNNVLCWQHEPDGEWFPVTRSELTDRLLASENELHALRAQKPIYRVLGEQNRDRAVDLVKLGNARSRMKHALQFTWKTFGISDEIQAAMLECVLNGNQMENFERLIAGLSVADAASAK